MAALNEGHDAETRQQAQEALNSLPQKGITYACAYGSRVMQNAKKSQLDLLVVVDDDQIKDWHYSNMLHRIYPGIYFHNYIQHPYSLSEKSEKLEGYSPYWKYGVMSMTDFVGDLENWSQLLAAGRLQKPVMPLVAKYNTHTSPIVAKAIYKNYMAAAAAAIIFLPSGFSELDFYYIVAQISYAGDIRMVLQAEDPKKTNKIAFGSVSAVLKWRKTYTPILNTLESEGYVFKYQKPSTFDNPLDIPIYKFEKNQSQLAALANAYLPLSIRQSLQVSAEHPNQFTDVLSSQLYYRALKSSTMQAITGAGMNSPMKSASYIIAKLAKGLR